MNSNIEKRRAFLINLAFLAAVLGLVYVFFKYLFWPVAPFLLSFFFAVLLQRPMRWLDKKTKRKCHALWAILLVLLSILIVLVPIILLLSRFIAEIANFVSYLTASLSDFPEFMKTLQTELLKTIAFLPDSLYNKASESIIETTNNLSEDFNLSKLGVNMSTVSSTISSGVTGIYSVAKNVPSVMLSIVIGIIAWILFTKDYDKIVRFLQLQLPEGKKNLLVEIKQVFYKTILKMVKAYGIIMLITFCELSLGFTILRMMGALSGAYIYLIALAITIFDILPVAGSGGILVPWALVDLIIGNYKLGIGLLIIYAAITVIRQYIEPKIVGDSLGVNPIITLAGLYFGLKLFGFIGMFIVPITVMTLKAFNDTGRISLWKIPAEKRIDENSKLINIDIKSREKKNKK